MQLVEILHSFPSNPACSGCAWAPDEHLRTEWWMVLKKQLNHASLRLSCSQPLQVMESKFAAYVRNRTSWCFANDSVNLTVPALHWPLGHADLALRVSWRTVDLKKTPRKSNVMNDKHNIEQDTGNQFPHPHMHHASVENSMIVQKQWGNNKGNSGTSAKKETT